MRMEIGSRFTWASRESVGVVRMAPVMLMAAILWTEVRRFMIPLDPRCMLPVSSLKSGLNQISAPYVNFGMAID